MRLPWGGLETEAVGAWDRLASAVRECPGTAIISHEILATASRSQVGRALASLGADDGPDSTEVHVVLSVRDLVRQIPAEWQENVKHRSPLSFERFLERIRDPERATRIGTWFWGVQEIPDILDRWGHDLPPERIHLVTVPPPGAPPGLLWERFSSAFGLDGIDLDLTAERANPSLGVPETALLRRINRSANRVLDPADYRPLVRELLAHQTLSRRSKSPRLRLPPTEYPWVHDLELAWVAEIERRGYDVIGEVSDLVGAEPEAAYADPDSPSERAVAGAAVDAIRALLLETARLRGEEARLAGELAGRARRARPGLPAAVVRRPPADGGVPSSGDRSGGDCFASTGGCGAGTPGRRSDRSSTSRTRRRRAPRHRRRPGSCGRPSWPSACRRPW